MSPVAASSDPASPDNRLSILSDLSLPPALSFKCAVIDSKGPRRTMEDAHSIVAPFAGVRGQGFFAIFDGHAGKQAAEWCGHNFAQCLLNVLRKDPTANIPDVLNQCFHEADSSLSKMSEASDGKMHSGCTVVTAFLRLESPDGTQSFLPPGFDPLVPPEDDEDDGTGRVSPSDSKKSGRSRFKNALRSLGDVGGRRASQYDDDANASANSNAYTPSVSAPIRRVLYCANAGDARGVLCRAGKAVRLTYDHKGSDKQEAKRIMDAGGFVMSGRVNGVLAVTRSLGDSSMKEFVVGAPYTTETELSEEDEFLILACDGLWDVVEDQAAVDLVRTLLEPKKAAEELLEHAYKNYSTDNMTVLVVRFRNPPEGTSASQ